MPSDLVYLNYWKRKKLALTAPEFAIRRHWWDTDDLSDAQEAIYDAIKHAPSVLDVGAGDLRLMHLVTRRGYAGVYHTQDIGHEFQYTYTDLADVKQQYGAVVCVDVLEHLPLPDGMALLHRLLSLVAPGGALVLQTPNANYMRHPLAWDMTHVHAYNPRDLWTYLTALGVATTVYRMVLGHPPRGLKPRVHEWLRDRIASELGLDYCENILVIGRAPEVQPAQR